MKKRSAVPSLGLSLLLLACSAGEGKGPEPSYEGCATDENWPTVDAALSGASDDSLQAPVFLAPAAADSLTSEISPQFRFQPSARDSGSDHGNASCPQYQPASSASRAPLHLPAVSGTLFDLHVQKDGQDVYRVLTTRQSASVPLSTWRTWAGAAISVTLYRVQLDKNEIVAGPFRSAPLILHIH